MSPEVFRQVFRLSLLSNGVAFCKGDQATLQKELQDYLTVEIPKTGAGWKLAWGPVVWKDKPAETNTGPENAWFIAFNPRFEFEDGSVHPTYAIAIAGTPVDSRYVWYFQNFQVYSVTDFCAWVDSGIENPPASVLRDAIVPDRKYIAKGTADATYLLLNTVAPTGAASAGTTLLEFVTSVEHSSPRFIFTGHSLGGALAPSLALSLVSAEVIPSDRTLTYPSAGPSAGNQDFSELFTEKFPARKEPRSPSYEGWNLNWINTLDIVPQAWAASPDVSKGQNLLNILTIYGEPTVRKVEFFVGAALGISSIASGVAYSPIPSQEFEGNPPAKTPETLEEFLAIAVPQHIGAYMQEIRVAVEMVCPQPGV